MRVQKNQFFFGLGLTRAGDSTPDMEKLIAFSDLFEISLDQLVLGKEQSSAEPISKTSEVRDILEEKVLTIENKKKARKGLKIAGIIAGIGVVVDVISMIIYFILYGVPK